MNKEHLLELIDHLLQQADDGHAVVNSGLPSEVRARTAEKYLKATIEDLKLLRNGLMEYNSRPTTPTQEGEK